MPLLSDTAADKFRQLCNVQFAEGLRALNAQIGQANALCAAKGMFHSGARLLMIERAVTAELANRGTLIWRNMVRVHRTYGPGNAGEAAPEFKALFNQTLEDAFDDLGRLLRDTQTQGGSTTVCVDTFEAERPHLIQKHSVEIDLYCEDSARNGTAGEDQVNPSYNFYGTIGSVQTGPNATSTVTQTIGSGDKERLKSALREVQAELAGSAASETDRDELMQMMEDTIVELDQPKPNGRKLTSLLTTVGTTVQTLAAAPQAYQLLKSALIPLGIILP